MVSLDASLILDQILALAVVLLPVEAGVLSIVYTIRRQLTDPESRRQLLAEAAEELWEPFKDPEQRTSLIREVAATIWEPFKTPEQRNQMIAELLSPDNINRLGHGLMRAFTERAGSLKGAAVRSLQTGLAAEARERGDMIGLAKALPGKVDVPVLGKVTPGELIELLASGKELLSGGGGLRKIFDSTGTSSTGGGGYPP